MHKLAVTFEHALLNPVDLRQWQRTIQHQKRSITNKFTALPKKAQPNQSDVLAKLGVAEDLLANPKYQERPYARLILMLTVLGSSAHQLAHLIQLAGELFFREMICHSAQTGQFAELSDLEADAAVFPENQIIELCEAFSDFLDETVNRALDASWPDHTQIPDDIHQVAASHKVFIAANCSEIRCGWSGSID